MPDLFTTEEAAALLRVSRQTVYRLLERGELHGLRLGSGPRAPFRIERAELARFLRQDPAAASFPPDAVDRIAPAVRPVPPRGGSRDRAAGGAEVSA